MLNGNSLSILQKIRQAGQLTRRDLANQLGVGISMMSRLTTELIDGGFLREVGRTSTANGRPSDLLSLNPESGYAVGLDAGGNHLRAVILDLCGNVVTQLSRSGLDMSSRSAIIDHLLEAVTTVLWEAGLGRSDVRGIGISLYGSVDPTSGTVYSWTETPGFYETWKNFNIRQAFLERWTLPHLYVDDVVRTLGMAELLFGQSVCPDEDFVYVLADTGIGAALMIKGQAYVGPSQLAGELGHLPLNRDRIPCSCGNVGCLETISSVYAITNLVERRLREVPMDSALSDSGRTPDILRIIAAAERGDRLAYRVLAEAGEALGRGIAITLNLLGTSQVRMGGILAASNVYFDAAHSAVRLNILSKVAQSLRFERSELDEFAAARGAAGIVLNALFQPGDHNILALAQNAAE